MARFRAFKLTKWLELLDDLEANDAETWSDDSLNISKLEGPRPKLVSLIWKEGGLEKHRSQMGQEIYNKLATRYMLLGHDVAKMHCRMMAMITAYDLLCVNTKTSSRCN